MAESPSLTFRTNFTPPVTFNPFAKKEIRESGVSLLTFLQPSIDGSLPIVGKVHYAPHGEPSGAGLVAIAFVGLLALYGAYKLIER